MHFVNATYLILRTISIAVISELFVMLQLLVSVFMQFSMLCHCHCNDVTEFHSDLLETRDLDVKSNYKHILLGDFFRVSP